jgi:hypothetical protein
VIPLGRPSIRSLSISSISTWRRGISTWRRTSLPVDSSAERRVSAANETGDLRRNGTEKNRRRTVDVDTPGPSN